MQQNIEQKNLKADGTPKSPKQLDAERKAAEWQSLSLQAQLAELDRRLGVGQGAGKQRARIHAVLDASAHRKSTSSPVNTKHTSDEKIAKQITHAQAAVASEKLVAPQKPMTRPEYKKALRDGKIKPAFAAPGTPIAA